MGDLGYGLVVLVPLPSTPDCSDAVAVRYRTALRRTGADLHRPILPPSQAHERGWVLWTSRSEKPGHSAFGFSRSCAVGKRNPA
jgi:hypothetical protein